MTDIILLGGTFVALILSGAGKYCYLPSIFYLVAIMTVYQNPIDFIYAGFISAFLGSVLERLIGSFTFKESR